MKRRLVKQGATTLMVSLPSKWVKQHNLDKGDEVAIIEDEQDLRITAEGNEVKKETHITFTSDVESSVRTLITNAYRAGYDRITIEYTTEKQLKALQEVIKTRLIGFEITKTEKNKCVVENITEPAADQFDTLLRKIFANIHELFTATKVRMEGKAPTESYEEIEERINKYENFCRRVVAKGKAPVDKPDVVLLFITNITHGQRELYHLNRNFEWKASKQTQQLIEHAEKLFGFIEKAYVEKDTKLLAHVHELEKKLIYEYGYALLENAKGKETIAAYHILASIRLFYQANSPLTALLM